MTLDQFVVFAMSADGVSIILGVLMSGLAKNVPGFAELSAQKKRLVFLSSAILIPLLLGVAAGVWVLKMPLTADLVFVALQAGFVAATSGTFAHTRELTDRTATTQLGQETMTMYREAVQKATADGIPLRYDVLSREIMNRIAHETFKG